MSFASNCQHDVSEFIIKLIGQIHNDFEEYYRLNPVNALYPVQEFFQMRFKNTFKCLNCIEKEIVSEIVTEDPIIESHNILKVEVPEIDNDENLDLINLIKSSFAEVEVTKNCTACSTTNVPHLVNYKLENCPQILIVHLKRFQYNIQGSKKLDNKIQFSDNLNLNFLG